MPPDPSSEYEDDPSIDDGDVLYRLVGTGTTKFEEGVAVRGATNAFQDYPPDRLHEVGAPAVAVSVFLASVMGDRGISVHDLADRWGSGYGVVSITASEARSEDQGVVRWPTESDPEHAMIFCLNGPKKSGGQSKRLARKSVVVVAPS